MKNSKPKRDINTSKTSMSVEKPTIIPDVCHCGGKSDEMDQILDNFESDEERASYRSFFKKATVSLGTKNKNMANHLHPYLVGGSLYSFQLCPFLHYEVGLWKSLAYGIVKSGSSLSNSGATERVDVDVNRDKVPQECITPVKKQLKNKTGIIAVSGKHRIFRHNVPIEQILQDYREKNAYSKLRLSRVDKQAILNAIHHAASQNDPLPAALIEAKSHAVCAKIVNLSFHDDDFHESTQEDFLNKSTKLMQSNQTTSSKHAGSRLNNTCLLQDILGKKISSINKGQPIMNRSKIFKAKSKTKQKFDSTKTVYE